VQKTVLMVLLAIVLGPLSLRHIIAASPMVHRHLATSPTRHENANLTSDILPETYFSAYGAGPTSFKVNPHHLIPGPNT